MTDQHPTNLLSAARATMKQVCSNTPAQRPKSSDLQHISRFVVAVFVVAIGVAGWVGWKADAVGPVLLWAFASCAVGGRMGFLFGIPKSGLTLKTELHAGGAAEASTNDASVVSTGGQTDPAHRARPNTNLEEVSDWLTKIIVGLTLVHLQDLRGQIKRIGFHAAEAIQPDPNAAYVSVATALVVGFTLTGFLVVYLYMRLFLQGAIVRSDDDMMNRYRDAVEEAVRVGAGEASPETEELSASPVVPSAASLSAAQAVADAAPQDPELLLQPLRQLASEYESLRQKKEYSTERTREMTDIVRRMRPHAIAAAPYIGDLMRSTSTGEHLAATVVLQMKYIPEHMQWLVRRLVEERAFIGYQAASALLARVRVAGPPESKAIQDAVKIAKLDREQLSMSESSLDSLIDQILAAR